VSHPQTRSHLPETSDDEAQFSQRNFPIMSQLRAQGSASHILCQTDNLLRFFSRYAPAFSHDHELRIIVSCFVRRIGIHHMKFMLLSLHTPIHPNREPARRAMCHRKHAPRDFSRAASYGALWENLGPDHPSSLGLPNYKSPLTSP